MLSGPVLREHCWSYPARAGKFPQGWGRGRGGVSSHIVGAAGALLGESRRPAAPMKVSISSLALSSLLSYPPSQTWHGKAARGKALGISEVPTYPCSALKRHNQCSSADSDY